MQGARKGYILDLDAWRILVPLNTTEFLWDPSTSRFSDVSNTWMDSFKSGVDSPDSIASLTIVVPLIRRISAGTVVSGPTRAVADVRIVQPGDFWLHTD